MNVYAKKVIWKRLLFAAALLIIGVSLWYTRQLVEKVAAEERNKVKLWAEAIQKKAKLVNYTDQLFNELRNEERKKVEQYVEAIKRLADADASTDFSFLTRILTDNTTVPVMLIDDNDKIKSFRNIADSLMADSATALTLLSEMKEGYAPIKVNLLNMQTDYVYYKDSRLFEELQRIFSDLEQSFISEVVSNSAAVPVLFTDSIGGKVLAHGNIDSTLFATPAQLKALIDDMKAENKPIEIQLSARETNFIYYNDSEVLKQLRYYPIVQFVVIGLFALIAYLLFSTSRNEEQNLIWVGLAKETAHQLGTPLSSLMAWTAILKNSHVDDETISYLESDIKRLEVITERFSKIGSQPKLESTDLHAAVSQSVSYFEKRFEKVKFEVLQPENTAYAMLNLPLFDWVIENLTKNALDAMNVQGKLSFSIHDNGKYLALEVSDTGKGIPANKRKAIFKPGFTTKPRGWGLGLSLVKRIIENYHKGKIIVKSSEVNKGTTFRILLKKA